MTQNIHATTRELVQIQKKEMKDTHSHTQTYTSSSSLFSLSLLRHTYPSSQARSNDRRDPNEKKKMNNNNMLDLVHNVRL